jgi:hypothetical protein
LSSQSDRHEGVSMPLYGVPVPVDRSSFFTLRCDLGQARALPDRDKEAVQNKFAKLEVLPIISS